MRYASVGMQMILDLYLRYWISCAILAAANLRVADVVTDEPQDIQAIAKLVAADTDCLLRLLRALACVGVFREESPRHFVHTPRSTALRTGHPGNEGALIRMFGIKSTREAASEYENAIRTGRPAYEFSHGTSNPFDILASRPDEAVIYHDAMATDGEVVAQILERCDFAGLRNIVDLGGGRGTLLARILRADPNKHGVLFDLPEVLRQHVLEAHGVLERCEVRSGDLSREVPADGDGYILKNLLHALPDDECVALLERIRDKAAPRARVFIIENVMGMQKHFDFANVFDLFLLLGGRRARVRSEEEFRAVLGRAGLECLGVRQVFQSQGVIEARTSGVAV